MWVIYWGRKKELLLLTVRHYFSINLQGPRTSATESPVLRHIEFGSNPSYRMCAYFSKYLCLFQCSGEHSPCSTRVKLERSRMRKSARSLTLWASPLTTWNWRRCWKRRIKKVNRTGSSEVKRAEVVSSTIRYAPSMQQSSSRPDLYIENTCYTKKCSINTSENFPA